MVEISNLSSKSRKLLVVLKEQRGISLFALSATLLLLLVVHGMQYDTPSYDGAINLQVSQNLSEHLTFTPLSHEIGAVQTSSIFLYTSAVLIKIFGSNTLTFIFSSAIYIVFLMFVVSKISRSYFTFSNEIFVVIYFGIGGIPFFYDYGFGGFGEFLGAGFAFLGLYHVALSCNLLFLNALASNVQENTSKITRKIYLAGFVIGIAISIKWVFFLAYCAALTFLFIVFFILEGSQWFVLKAKPPRTSRLKNRAPLQILKFALRLTFGSLTALGIHLLFLSFLLWRSDHGIMKYLAKITSGIAAQGGGSDRFTDTSGFFKKIDVHSGILSEQLGVGRFGLIYILLFLLFVLVLSFIELLRVCLARCDASEAPCLIELERMRKKLNVALLNLVFLTYGFGLLLWWLVLTPTQKAWDRRVAVGVLCLLLVLVFNSVLLGRLMWGVWRARGGTDGKRTRINSALTGLGVVVLSGSLVVGPLGSFKFVNPLDVPKAASAIRLRNSTQVEWAQHLNFLEGLEARGLSAYGSGWKRSPRSSLYSGTPVLDVSETSPRDLLSADKLVLVGEPLSYPNLVAFSGFSLRPNLKHESKKWGRFWHEELTPVSPTNEALYLSLIRQITDGLALERNSCGSGGGLGAGFEVLAGAYGQEAGGRWLSGASHLLLSRECFDQGNDPLSIYWPSEASSSQQLDIYFSDGSCIESLNLLIAPGKLGSIRYGDLMESCKGDVGVLSVYAEQVMSDGRQLGAYLVDGA